MHISNSSIGRREWELGDGACAKMWYIIGKSKP